MALRFKIENFTTLPDGGPLSIAVTGKRGIDIGRDQHLDWTLPDASRVISGKHCEVRYKDGSYWLHDVSTNGTYVNGNEQPIRGAHRLRTGDRVEIGDYLIGVEIDEQADASAPARPTQAIPTPSNPWEEAVDIAPPEPVQRRRVLPAFSDGDFLDRHVDLIQPPPFQAVARPAPLEETWDAGSPSIWGEDDSSPHQSPPAPQVPRVRSAVQLSPAPSAPSLGTAPATPMDAQAPRGDATSSFARAVARGAGVPETVFDALGRDELPELLGKLLRLSAENLRQLLAARGEFKEMLGEPRTMISAAENNPIRHAKTVQEILALLFAARSSSYLDAQTAFTKAFRDIKHHQVQTFAAIQIAVAAMGEDFDPRNIEATLAGDRSFGQTATSRKARLWEAYENRWKTKVQHREDGMLGLFLGYFSDCYDPSC